MHGPSHFILACCSSLGTDFGTWYYTCVRQSLHQTATTTDKVSGCFLIPSRFTAAFSAAAARHLRSYPPETTTATQCESVLGRFQRRIALYNFTKHAAWPLARTVTTLPFLAWVAKVSAHFQTTHDDEDSVCSFRIGLSGSSMAALSMHKRAPALSESRWNFLPGLCLCHKFATALGQQGPLALGLKCISI